MKTGPKLKVGLVFDDSLDRSDGVAQYVKTLGGWLARQGHDVSYLVGETHLQEWSGGKVYSLSKNLKVKFNGNRLSMPLIAKRSDIMRVIRDEKFDVLHVMTPYSPLMAKRVIKAARKSTAVVGTFHIMPSGPVAGAGSRLLGLWLRRSLRRFDAMASVSDPARQFAKQAFRLNSVVIPNPVDLSMFGRRTNKNDPHKIVFLGRLVKRKGCRQLIQAFALAAADNQELRLVIAGDGPERPSLEKLVERLGLSGRVQFLGFIDEADKPGLLGSAAVACFPSLYGESFGIVLIEAMAAGAGVVIGGDNPGYSSVLSEGPLLLVDPRDTEALANKLSFIFANSDMRQEAHEWQSQSVKQYDINVVGNRIVDLYEEAIANRAKNGHNVPHE